MSPTPRPPPTRSTISAASPGDIKGEYIDLGGSFAYTRREPLGVCAGIGAWNYPIQIAAWKSAPALACGNSFVFKPSETTPLTALKLAEIYQEAGLPDGVFNVVQGRGEVGGLLASHPGIDKVSLTGSVATGARVMAAASPTLKHVTLELGGKSPLVVFKDADLDDAVSGAMLGNFYSTGQICSNGTRVFVQRDVKRAFMERLVERTRKIRLGDPLDEATHLGPLVSKAQYDKVLDYMRLGVEGGATLAVGGEPASLQGFERGLFVEPTVFADVQDGMRIATEEIFGPVMCVLDFDDEAEVVARANAHETGLAGRRLHPRPEARAPRRRGAQGRHLLDQRLQPDPGGACRSAASSAPASAARTAAARSRHYSQLKSVYVEMNGVEAPY